MPLALLTQSMTHYFNIFGKSKSVKPPVKCGPAKSKKRKFEEIEESESENLEEQLKIREKDVIRREKDVTRREKDVTRREYYEEQDYYYNRDWNKHLQMLNKSGSNNKYLWCPENCSDNKCVYSHSVREWKRYNKYPKSLGLNTLNAFNCGPNIIKN